MAKNVILLGAFDTKGEEYDFIKQLLEAQGHQTLTVDTGVLGEPKFKPDISREETASAGGGNIAEFLSGEHKDRAMQVMTSGATKIIEKLHHEGKLDGIFAMGGTGGTSIATAAMRNLPVGIPKVMVSTVAGGDVSAYAGTKDIIFIPSIVDVAGLNRISQTIFTNAAAAMSGMLNAEYLSAEEKPLIAASMFGNTTTAIDKARGMLEAKGYEVLVFHATGIGGKTMEGLIADGFITGSFDLTTTELADYVCGGVFSAGPDRCQSASEKGIPTILVPGCVDMANFGSIDTVPNHFKDRQLYEWNPNVTLLRTNLEENRKIGELLITAANKSTGPVAVLLPLKGVSMLDSPNGAFWDSEADNACFEAIRSGAADHVKVIEVDKNINDPEFVSKAVDVFLHMFQEV